MDKTLLVTLLEDRSTAASSIAKLVCSDSLSANDVELILRRSWDAKCDLDALARALQQARDWRQQDEAFGLAPAAVRPAEPAAPEPPRRAPISGDAVSQAARARVQAMGLAASDQAVAAGRKTCATAEALIQYLVDHAPTAVAPAARAPVTAARATVASPAASDAREAADLALALELSSTQDTPPPRPGHGSNGPDADLALALALSRGEPAPASPASSHAAPTRPPPRQGSIDSDESIAAAKARLTEIEALCAASAQMDRATAEGRTALRPPGLCCVVSGWSDGKGSQK